MSIRNPYSKSNHATALPASLIAAGTPSTRPSPVDIPEILDHIFSYLDRKATLHVARSVCRQWYHASRHFFTHPLIVTGSCSKPEKFRLVLKRLPYSGSLYWKTIRKRDGNGPWYILRDALENMNKEFSSDQPLNRSGSRPLSTLEQLHLERAAVIVGSNPWQLSSLDLALGASGPLVPSPSDKTLQLKALTLKSCHVDLTTLADIVAVSPRLIELELVAMTLTDDLGDPDDPGACHKIEQEEFVALVGRACPNLYKLHYSNRWSLAPMALKAVQALFRDIPRVPER
ncbi:hypothetical protein BG006_009328, partial [Podila minutissima]